MLPLLIRSALTVKTSASACQHSSAVKGGPIAALHRTLCSLFGAPLKSHLHLHFIHPSQHWSLIIEPTGFLCKMSLRLLSSSLRLFSNLLKKSITALSKCQGYFHEQDTPYCEAFLLSYLRFLHYQLLPYDNGSLM